jgi:hypothetical protein
MGRSGQTPYYRFINDSGHDGGDFVFSKASIAVSPIVIIAPPPKDKDKEGVQAALDAYQRAYDSMAPQNMKEIWPSISREQLNDLKKSFSMFRAITVELRQRETTVDGNTATVHCYQWLQYTDDTLTRHPPQTWPVEIILAKNSSGQWLVTNVNKK